MERITSFTIDHDVLVPGFYISRKDGDITTYDLRTRRPNKGDYMSNADMHSVEHMFATYIRNSEIADSVIYFGPMGCQTGFYLLVRDVEPKKVFQIRKRCYLRSLLMKERYLEHLRQSVVIMRTLIWRSQRKSAELILLFWKNRLTWNFHIQQNKYGKFSLAAK